MNRLVIVVVALALIAVALVLGAPATGNAVKNFSPQTTGTFGLSYSAPSDKSLDSIYGALTSNGVFGGLVKDLNTQFKIPVDVVIKFSQCGSATAFYDPQQKTVDICYEFIKNMESLYATSGQNSSDAAISNAEFVFYHEIGHALIDTLNIPFTGREEDAADQLALLMVLSGGDAPAVVTAYALGVQSQNQQSQLWDEHSLDGQRFYNIICWLYGQNPDKYQAAVSQLLPEERSKNCVSEYNKMVSSWTRLLQPHTR